MRRQQLLAFTLMPVALGLTILMVMLLATQNKPATEVEVVPSKVSSNTDFLMLDPKGDSEKLSENSVTAPMPCESSLRS